MSEVPTSTAASVSGAGKEPNSLEPNSLEPNSLEPNSSDPNSLEPNLLERDSSDHRDFPLGAFRNDLFEKFSFTHATIVNAEPEWLKVS